MKTSAVILLDGVSSSGKTTLAKKLQRLSLDRIIYRYSVDDFFMALPLWHIEQIFTDGDWGTFESHVCKFHAMIAASTEIYDLVVVDHVFEHPRWRADFMSAVGKEKILYVQVYCPLEVLEQREKAREDRNPGQARAQFKTVYSFNSYDLKVDTSQESPDRCAQKILSHLLPDLRSGGAGQS